MGKDKKKDKQKTSKKIKKSKAHKLVENPEIQA
jgi:hypothetical protein